MTRQFQFNFLTHEDKSTLQQEYQKLLEAAIEAQARAYAPYSEFTVGAAILLHNSIIITGNNQENAAYPSGLCAERVSVFSAISQFPDQKISAIAIYGGNNKFPLTTPISPCGACRQSLLEYEIRQAQPIEVILAGSSSSIYVLSSVKHLLPLHFEEVRLRK
jgi:cytidine deaminase